jgi:WD40 repeat protein
MITRSHVLSFCKRHLFRLLSFVFLLAASWYVWVWVIPAQPRATFVPFSNSDFVSFTADSRILITREPQRRLRPGGWGLRDMVSCPSRIQMWDVKNGTLLRTLSGEWADMDCVAPTADSRRLVAWKGGKPGESPNVIQTCDIRSGEIIERITQDANDRSGMAMEFSADDKWLAITPHSGNVGHFYLWRKGSDNFIHFDGAGPRLTFSEDGQLMAASDCGVGDFSIEVWRLCDLTRPWRKVKWSGEKGIVFPDCRTAATYHLKDFKITEAKLWDLTKGRVLATFPVNSVKNHIRFLDFPKDGQIQKDSVDSTGSTAIWDINGQPRLIAVLNEWKIAVSPDRSWVLQSEEKGVHLVGLRSGKSFSLTNRSDDSLSNQGAPGEFSPDSRMVVVTGIGRLVKPHPVIQLLGTFLPVKSVEELRPIARLWDVEAGAEVASFDGCGKALFSPDSKTVAGLHEDATVRLWDVTPRTEITRILASAVALWLVVFLSPKLWRKLHLLGMKALSGLVS